MGQVGHLQRHSHKNKKSENENNTLSVLPFNSPRSPYSRNPHHYEHSRKFQWESNEKLSPLSQTFITQNEISASPQLIPAHNPSSFALFIVSSPTSPLLLMENQTIFQRRSNNIATTFQRNPFTSTGQFTPNCSRFFPISTRINPIHSTSSAIAMQSPCNNRENLHRNRQNSFRNSLNHFCSQC